MLCGHTALWNFDFGPVVSRINHNIVDLITEGFLPPSARCDPVRWEKREHNKVADYLCNMTMDSKRCTWRDVRHTVAPQSCNFLAFSDGGTRSTCSASAWIICAVLEDKTIPMVAGGIYFEQPISSFTAEAIALEKATVELSFLLSVKK